MPPIALTAHLQAGWYIGVHGVATKRGRALVHVILVN